MYELFWYFLIYAFLGWCAEVMFAAVKTGTFVNRGFLMGPVCPIYGLGVCFVMLMLKPLGGNLLILFLGSVVITSALEYLVGYLAERFLHQRLWDYSKMPFNIKGYVCLAFSLMWGVACVLVVRVIHPLIAKLVGFLPQPLGWTLLGVFGAVFLADLILTGAAAWKLPREIKAAEELAKMIRALSDSLGEDLYQGVSKLDLEEKKEALASWKQNLDAQVDAHKQAREARRAELEARVDAKVAAYRAAFGESRTYRRLSRAFPNLREQSHHHHLEAIRSYLAQKNQKEQDETHGTQE